MTERPIAGDVLPVLADGDRAAKLESVIMGAVTKIREQWVVVAAGLYQFHEEQAWIALGYETFEDWVDSPEISIGHRTAYNLTQIYRMICVERQIPPQRLAEAEWTKVVEVLPAVRRHQVSADEALADAISLSRADLRKRYPAGAVEPQQITTATEEPMIPCPTCGKLMKRKPESLEPNQHASVVRLSSGASRVSKSSSG